MKVTSGKFKGAHSGQELTAEFEHSGGSAQPAFSGRLLDEERAAGPHFLDHEHDPHQTKRGDDNQGDDALCDHPVDGNCNAQASRPCGASGSECGRKCVLRHTKLHK